MYQRVDSAIITKENILRAYQPFAAAPADGRVDNPTECSFCDYRQRSTLGTFRDTMTCFFRVISHIITFYVIGA